MNEKSSHLTFEQLTDLAVKDSSNTALTEHLQLCPKCELEFSRIRQTVEAMQSDRAEEVPADAFSNVMQAFRIKQISAKNVAPTLREKLQAILQSDSFGLTPNFGFRSGQSAKSRQMLYFAGNTALDLRISPQNDEWIIEGQVLGHSGAGELILIGNSVNHQTTIDAEFNFNFPPIPNGIYTIIFISENTEIVVSDLVIEP